MGPGDTTGSSQCCPRGGRAALTALKALTALTVAATSGAGGPCGTVGAGVVVKFKIINTNK